MTKRTPSIHLQKLEALHFRVIEKHPNCSLIEKDYRIKRSGFKGEQQLDYYLSFVPAKICEILPDIRLQANANLEHYFQMDTILKTTKYNVIFETKNHTGEVTYNTLTNQLTRINELGELEVFQDPIQQVKRQELQYKKLLQSMNPQTQQVPLIPLIVFTNPNCHIKIVPEGSRLPKNMIKAESVPSKLYELEKMYKQELIETKVLRQLTKKVLKSNTPYNPDILEKYHVKEQDLITGVFCLKCINVKMRWVKNSCWRCENCGFKNKNAFLKAVNEMILLYGNEITNKQFSNFLEIPSRVTSYRHITNLACSTIGFSKSRKYLLSLQNQYPILAQQ
ncbi:nuclease-related domain-containing protein [Bacillus alkalisoli]|uniref:nuclease-related domain-containing protein n=1 Tax=Bacillus alkalisoli TaxID=2011008 RepID=UPI0012FEEB48|nr:nuclease-related domain-containing protein [Bacillus alkalisoli]